MSPSWFFCSVHRPTWTNTGSSASIPRVRRAYARGSVQTRDGSIPLGMTVKRDPLPETRRA